MDYLAPWRMPKKVHMEILETLTLETEENLLRETSVDVLRVEELYLEENAPAAGNRDSQSQAAEAATSDVT